MTVHTAGIILEQMIYIFKCFWVLKLAKDPLMVPVITSYIL